MDTRWYVWVDQIAVSDDWTLDAPTFFLHEADGATGWLPLVICGSESEADAVGDALVVAKRDIIRECGLVVYRNPLSECDTVSDALLIADMVDELSRLVAGNEYDPNPLTILASRAIQLKNTLLTMVGNGHTEQKASTYHLSSPNAKRNAWLYERRKADVRHDAVIAELATHTEWEPIYTAAGINDAIDAHAAAAKLPQIRGKGGRPKKPKES